MVRRGKHDVALLMNVALASYDHPKKQKYRSALGKDYLLF